MLQCKECGHQLPTFKPKCPHCFAEGSLIKNPLEIRHINPDSDKQVEKTCYKTCFDGLDAMLNGGLTTGRGYFLYGRPGIGKTTLLLQILSSLQKRGEK